MAKVHTCARSTKPLWNLPTIPGSQNWWQSSTFRFNLIFDWRFHQNLPKKPYNVLLLQLGDPPYNFNLFPGIKSQSTTKGRKLRREVLTIIRNFYWGTCLFSYLNWLILFRNGRASAVLNSRWLKAVSWMVRCVFLHFYAIWFAEGFFFKCLLSMQKKIDETEGFLKSHSYNCPNLL